MLYGAYRILTDAREGYSPPNAIYIAAAAGAVPFIFFVPKYIQRAMLACGIMYGTGMICKIKQIPRLIPGVFEGHEIFHLFVISSSIVTARAYKLL